MVDENLKLSGRLSITLKDKNGNVKDSREVENLIVDGGLGFITSRMIGTGGAVMSHMALGSGATAVSAAQTDLVSILGAREVLDSSVQSGANSQSVVYTASFEGGDATGAVVEAGIFNAATAGTMLCRTTFAVVNKGVDDFMNITWTVTLAAS